MMESQKPGWFQRVKPFIAVVFLQVGFAGMDVLSKAALNNGMSNYALVVYRHAVAFFIIAPFAVVLDKKVRPKMTFSVFTKIVVLSVLEPVIDQNLYFLGMKYTTTTFAAAMTNILPAITFIMACILRLEKWKIRSIRSQAKVFGTVATVAGAMVMTLVKGPVLELLTHGNNSKSHNSGPVNLQHAIKGSVMITIGSFSWACFMILQLPFCFSRQLLLKPTQGVVCSGMAYYIQGVVMKTRGPVFVTAFSPLCLVIVAIMGSIFLAEQWYLGRVTGAIVIVLGLYLVVWGKSKDSDSPTPIPKEQILPDNFSSDEGNAPTEHSNHEIITIKF